MSNVMVRENLPWDRIFLWHCWFHCCLHTAPPVRLLFGVRPGTRACCCPLTGTEAESGSEDHSCQECRCSCDSGSGDAAVVTCWYSLSLQYSCFPVTALLDGYSYPNPEQKKMCLIFFKQILHAIFDKFHFSLLVKQTISFTFKLKNVNPHTKLHPNLWQQFEITK